jgi:hypothetical protein
MKWLCGSHFAQLLGYDSQMPQMLCPKELPSEVRTLLPKIRLSKNPALEVPQVWQTLFKRYLFSLLRPK